MSDTDFEAALAQAASVSGEENTTDDSTTQPDDASASEAAVSDGDSGEAPAADDAPDGTDDSDDGADDDADADDDSEPTAGSRALEDVKELFLNGDKDAAMKALGLDPKVLDVNPAKLKAMREGLKEARETKAKADTLFRDAAAKEANAQAIIADGKKQYGPLVDLKLALKAGDFTAAHDILLALTPEGTTYRQVAEGMARAASTMTPSERIYRDKLRKLAEDERKAEEARERAKQEEASKTNQQTEAQRNLAGATRLLEKTELSDIPGAAAKLVELAAKEWDPVTKGLKVSREELVKRLEKDPVIGGLLELKRLKANGGKPPARPAPPVEREKGSGKFKSRRTPAAAADPKQKERDEFAAAMAEATRMEAAERRQKRSR